MGFFAREYANSTDIIVQALDRLLGENKPLTGDTIKQAIFDIKTFKSSTAEITFTSNTAVRPVEIYRHGDNARELVKFDPKM